MNNPLRYQISEYDCGPTTVLNAISFLLPRKQIPPDVIKYVHLYSLDGFNGRGEAGKTGTSTLAMSFLTNSLNEYARTKRWPLRCQILHKEDIHLTEGSPIIQALHEGAAAVLRLNLAVSHYVLLTGVDLETKEVYLFDPYYENPPEARRYMKVILDAPDRWNRKVSWAAMNRQNRGYYSMGPLAERECVLMRNTCQIRQQHQDSCDWDSNGCSSCASAYSADRTEEADQSHKENAAGR